MGGKRIVLVRAQSGFSAPEPRPVIRLGEDEGRQVILANGVIQSISPRDVVRSDGYWCAMLPCQRPSSALILGLAGGTVAWALAQRFGSAVRIVGVDDDESVLATAQELGWLGLPGLQVACADAFAYVEACTERFGHVALDLYRAERFIGRSLERRFLRRLADLLLPGGEITVNLFDDLRLERRMARIARVLDVEQRIQSGDNVVVHARRRRR